jgi:hypothetical protein
MSCPPISPLSYPIKRKPRQVNDVTAVNRTRPSRRAMVSGRRQGYDGSKYMSKSFLDADGAMRSS